MADPSADNSRAPHPAGRAAGALRIAQEAAEWVVRRDRGFAAAEESAYRRWRDADPRHAAELARIDHAWSSLDRLPESADLTALADDVFLRARARRRRCHVAWSALASLGVAAAIAFGALLREPAEAPLLVAPILENVRVIESTLTRETLSDGSVVERNGETRIEVAYTRDQREVRLLSGEAHFIVAQAPARPFVVTAGSLAVRAVGTAFNVRLESERVEVLVTHGTVNLATEGETLRTSASAGEPLALTAGQRVVVSRSAPDAAGWSVAETSVAEIDDYLAWQSTRLVFDDTTLAGVVEAFNRFNQQQLVLGDPRLSSRRLTGTFRADNLDGFVRLLRASVDVRSLPRGDREIVLLPAN